MPEIGRANLAILSAMRFTGLFVSLSLTLALAACDDGVTDTDGGPGDAAAEVMGCGSVAFPELTWSRTSVGMAGGAERAVHLTFDKDCLPGATLTLTASADGVVDAPATVTIPPTRDRVDLVLTGVAPGTITLTATASHESGDTSEAALEVVVIDDAPVAACDGSASGNVAPAGGLSVESGALAGAAIALPEGAARDDRYHVDPFDAAIDCAEDMTPAGYLALGPAVTFGPAHAILNREIPLTIPVTTARLPSGAGLGHVEVVWRGPHMEEARLVGIASPRFQGSAGGGTLTFEMARLGTYQAVVREDAPTRRDREFVFRGILGFSMGGSGSGRIGLGNPELFDFVAPLGGPTDWTFMLEHIRNYHVGGFCTEAERQLDPEGCAMGASLARTPPVEHIHEHPQHFEHWWYEDGFEGQGGTFNRTDYISIFRDLATMFGNPNYDRTADPSEPSVTPPGVPDEVRTMPASARCAPDAQIIVPPFDGDGDFLSGSEGAGFFDDEFNPDGQHPVITFCDGGEVPGDIGHWNPDGGHGMPIEVVLAVDVNANGVRDAGEPVIRNGREPFDDFGLDGVPSAMETSPDGTPYDPVTNPDPAGDDFHFQFNPGGTEGNWNRDVVGEDQCTAGEAGVAEAFLDVGIDGLMGTRQLAPTADLPGGGFDIGEGNGCFDRARGANRMIESSPRWLAEHMDLETLRDVDVFADGGIRDLFNWVVMANVTMAGWSNRGFPVRYYNGHAALHMDGRLELEHFDVPWEDVGRAAMVRYGDPDIDPRFITAGDGGHVGTGGQLIDRLRSGLMMMDARWPDGDRRRVTQDRICAENDREACGYVNTFVFDFTASTGRTGPVSMVLPPGYFLEENAGRSYPVVYFLHGYGMSPEDLVALGLLMWADMNTPRVGSSRRMQKMILVFPDGRCRGSECLRGTFYTDAPEEVPGGAQMQTFLLDLMQHVDAEYRTRSPESFPVIE